MSINVSLDQSTQQRLTSAIISSSRKEVIIAAGLVDRECATRYFDRTTTTREHQQPPSCHAQSLLQGLSILLCWLVHVHSNRSARAQFTRKRIELNPVGSKRTQTLPVHTHQRCPNTTLAHPRYLSIAWLISCWQRISIHAIDRDLIIVIAMIMR